MKWTKQDAELDSWALGIQSKDWQHIELHLEMEGCPKAIISEIRAANQRDYPIVERLQHTPFSDAMVGRSGCKGIRDALL